jgi:hypothetical protein
MTARAMGLSHMFRRLIVSVPVRADEVWLVAGGEHQIKATIAITSMTLIVRFTCAGASRRTNRFTGAAQRTG